MSFWHINCFELKALEKQQLQEGLSHLSLPTLKVGHIFLMRKTGCKSWKCSLQWKRKVPSAETKWRSSFKQKILSTRKRWILLSPKMGSWHRWICTNKPTIRFSSICFPHIFPSHFPILDCRSPDPFFCCIVTSPQFIALCRNGIQAFRPIYFSVSSFLFYEDSCVM